jgi:hypothetical protein
MSRDGARMDGLIEDINREMDRHPYLFASRSDGDPYRWLEKLACYAPIIHLQQTTGRASEHRPFTKAQNTRGIISANQVLRSIKASYDSPPEERMPPRCGEIYLTLELFSGTADHGRAIMQRMRESVRYWREVIPEDGLPLDELVSRMD